VPRELLYGYWWGHESLCVGDAETVRTLASEYAMVQACTTIGDLREAEPRLTMVPLPADLEELQDEPDETPWDWQEDGLGVGDGDWPAMPTSLALDRLDEQARLALLSIDGVGSVTTVFNGDYLYIPAEAEQALIGSLTALGYSLNRDDSLFDWGRD